MRPVKIILIATMLMLMGCVMAAEQATPTPTDRLVKVIVAGESIPMGTMITEDMLATIELPETRMVSVLFSSDRLDEVVGKLAKYPLEMGVPITSAVLANTTNDLPPCR